MEKVLQEAQKLAEAILESDIYQNMHKCEQEAMKNPLATQAISDFVEKRNQVEGMLAANDPDRLALAKLSAEMQTAEKNLDAIPSIKAMQDARGKFTQMMENVNQILRFVITGETEEEHSCGGNCGSCGGCGEHEDGCGCGDHTDGCGCGDCH